jgi:hypothetical protein
LEESNKTAQVIFLRTGYFPEKEVLDKVSKHQERIHYHKIGLENSIIRFDQYNKSMCRERFHNALRGHIKLVQEESTDE